MESRDNNCIFLASSRDDPVNINNAYEVLDLAKNVPECAMCC